MSPRYTRPYGETQAKALLALISILWASVASAQPTCRSVILPEPNTPQTAATGITHHLYYAAPPNPANGELWGRLSYPFHYTGIHPEICAGVAGCVAAPPGTVSVGLMYVMGQTYRIPGWQIGNLWGWRFDGRLQPIDPAKDYVFGRSGAVYPWVKDGIRYTWYPMLRVAPAGEPEAADGFRATIDNGDSVGIDNPLSTVMQLTEGVTLGVNVIYPYPEPVRSHVALHLRECR